MRAAKSVEFAKPIDKYAEILTPEAVAFVVGLQRTFECTTERVAGRLGWHGRSGWTRGRKPGFSAANEAYSRRVSGRSIPCLPDLLDRRVEITGAGGPEDDHQRAELGREVFMADFEDSTTPTWGEPD